MKEAEEEVTWKEFKDTLEAQGVKDEDKLEWITYDPDYGIAPRASARQGAFSVGPHMEPPP